VESESLPRLGTASGYELRSRTGETLTAQPELVDLEVLERTEQRLVKHLRGAGIFVLHDLAVPATATTIDHLCIGANGITAIDVERAPDHGRAELVGRVMRETEILGAILGEAEVRAEQICGAVCRSGRGISLRPSSKSTGAITIGDVRGVAKLARRARCGGPIDVQLALALVRTRLGREDQRSHRITRDGF
jgi:hypothetical protein